MFFNKLFIILSILPIAILTSLYFALSKPTIDLLEDDAYEFRVLKEPIKNNLSTASLQKNNNGIDIKYTLSDSIEHPYAGFRIIKKNEPLYSLSKYKLDISVKSSAELPLMIRTNQYIDGFSKQDNWQTFLLCERPVKLSKGDNNIRLNVSQIDETPNWWYSINTSWKDENNHADNSKISEISFICENGSPVGVDIDLRFDKFKLVYDASNFLYYILIAVIYYIIIFIVYLTLKHKNIEYVFMPIKEIEINKNLKDKISGKEILAFIGENYQTPDFKINDVANHFNITETQTSDILKDYCNKSFRQYLNQIRMEEAKRLLKETDQQISTIAFSIGYNNVQHFNRVFKEYTNSSPSVFRGE